MVLQNPVYYNKFVTCLEFISPLVSLQRQVDSTYFDLNSAFDLVSHSSLFHKLRAHWLSGGYQKWFNSYLSNQQSSLRILDTFLLHSVVSSGVPRGSVLETLLFNTLINDLYKVIKHSKLSLLFVHLMHKNYYKIVKVKII